MWSSHHCAPVSCDAIRLMRTMDLRASAVGLVAHAQGCDYGLESPGSYVRCRTDRQSTRRILR
jgi:hypothetical protein